MANCKLVFIGDGVGTFDMELQCYSNTRNQVFIQINEPDDHYGVGCKFICLDKSTAIKFSKALRTAISEITD